MVHIPISAIDMLVIISPGRILNMTSSFHSSRAWEIGSQLSGVERRAVDWADHGAEIDGRNGRDVSRDVRLRGGQLSQVGVEEVISGADALDLVRRRVTCADHGDGSVGHAHAVVGLQVAC